MKRILLSTVAIASSFLAGYGLSSYLQKNLASTIGLSAGSSLFGGGVVWMYFDTKLHKQRNELQSKIDRLNKKLESLKISQASSVLEQSNLQKRIEESAQKIAQIVSESLITEDKLSKTLDDNSTLRQDIDKQLLELTDIKNQLKNVSAQRDEFKATVHFKEAELVSFEKEFQNKVDEKTRTNIKVEVVLETRRQFDLIEESEQILKDMDTLMSEVYQRHQSQKYYTLEISDKFTGYKNHTDAKNQLAFDGLLDEKSMLESEISKLNSKIANGLLVPVYKDYGLASIDGRVINGLIEWMYRHLEIPLCGLAFDDNDGVISFGVNYPKQTNPNDICKLIMDNGQNLKGYLGIHNLTRAEYIAKFDAIVISYRHTAPRPESDDEMFKDGLLPRSQFCDAIFKATDHTTAGKPTLRIMAATGEGKGICTKHIVDYFSSLEEWEVWVSDPVHGTEQDYWDCQKIAKDKGQARKAFSTFEQLHTTRKDLKIDGFTPNHVLGIFDEFDKQHQDDDKAKAADIMTALRHTKQRQILIGQCAEVGANGWTWDDMKQCSLLVLGDSIGTLCKHLVKDLGWTLKKSNLIKAKYEKFSDWAIKKNENPDTPTENQTRIGLLITGSKFQFLELPIPHKGILRNPKIKSSLSTNTQNVFTPNNLESSEIKAKTSVVKPEIKCTHCGSMKFTRKQKVKDPLMYSYTCKDCEQSFTSYNNKPANSNQTNIAS